MKKPRINNLPLLYEEWLDDVTLVLTFRGLICENTIEEPYAEVHLDENCETIFGVNIFTKDENNMQGDFIEGYVHSEKEPDVTEIKFTEKDMRNVVSYIDAKLDEEFNTYISDLSDVANLQDVLDSTDSNINGIELIDKSSNKYIGVNIIGNTITDTEGNEHQIQDLTTDSKKALYTKLYKYCTEDEN